MDKNSNNQKERVSIFIDGSNLYHSLRMLNGIKIDFQKLINELTKNRIMINTFYYIAPLDIDSDKDKYWKHQKFLSILEKIPRFKVVLCTLRKYKKNSDESGFALKGDDVYLANDLLVGAYENLYDTAILVSGDEDFVPVVNTLKRLKKKTENAFVKNPLTKVWGVFGFLITRDLCLLTHELK